MFNIFKRSKQPIKAKLGEKNTLYYNKELKCWVEPGKEHEVQSNSIAPPPMKFSTVTEKKNNNSTISKSAPQSRYLNFLI